MKRQVACALVLALTFIGSAARAGSPGSGRVLIVMDELEQMQALAHYLEAEGSIASTIVDQAALPADWTRFAAVIGYIHGDLLPETERRIIEYTTAGGRYVCLHHSISSGKIKNEHYFGFLGVALEGASQSRYPAPLDGHYAWREPVALIVVNLRPDHYITSHGVTWPETTLYRSSDRPSVEREYPSLTLEPSEAYMNVRFDDGREKTVLLGYKYLDDRNGVLFMQDREGWLEPSGEGWIVYLQMGHFSEEWRNPAVAQMVLNAVEWQPDGR